ncbi:MAG: hypothetical protein GX657_03770 [Chloroflexi bacterium]|nr:hypothetical protein [Chloroflexota bacterium]
MLDEPPSGAHQLHTPAHRFLPGATYIVTAATYGRRMLFDTPANRDALLDVLFAEVDRRSWRLEAWAVMANHYHWVGVAPTEGCALPQLVSAVHARSATWLNRTAGVPGRQVWYQYWDTCLTYERSYLARLNYVHTNPQRHGLVERAEEYRWCSMAWFVEGADEALRRAVLSLPVDRVRVPEF